MPCEQIKQLLAVSAREWSDAERALVEAHLLTCPACTALARDYANQKRGCYLPCHAQGLRPHDNTLSYRKPTVKCVDCDGRGICLAH